MTDTSEDTKVDPQSGVSVATKYVEVTVAIIGSVDAGGGVFFFIFNEINTNMLLYYYIYRQK